MNKEGFKRLFSKKVKEALNNARLTKTEPSIIVYELHGAGSRGETLLLEELLDKIYIDSEHFFRIIDIGVLASSKDCIKVFVRLSDHKPSSFEETWNNPPGNGPFKILIFHDP